MGQIERKSFDDPDVARSFRDMGLDLIRGGSLMVGRATIEPGFRWSTHMREASDESSCQVPHTQLLLRGRFAVRMDDGEYAEI